MTFSKDDKWNRAKDFINSQGMVGNWIEIIDYYRQIGGSHVAIFIFVDKNKYRILEVTKDNRVVLVDKDNNIHLMEYNFVLESKKMFFYIEEPNDYMIKLDENIRKITYSGDRDIKISK